ncbi:hypothetical protein [Anaerosporobacter sp.]
MRITPEQQDSLNKARCKQLKEIRKNMAAELGISLTQCECQNHEFCSGTCPKCQAEERLLNNAIKKQQHKVNKWKKKTMVAGALMATTLTLSSCTLSNINSNENINEEFGGEAMPNEDYNDFNELNGDVAWVGEDGNQNSINQDNPKDTYTPVNNNGH